MPDVNEVAAQCKWLIDRGRGSEAAKLLLPRIEAKRRVKNTEGRTRLVKQLDTPETYSEFNQQFDRYIRCAGNVQVAYSIMLRCLAQLSDEQIQTLAADEPMKESVADA
jgi:hypothetical protein